MNSLIFALMLIGFSSGAIGQEFEGRNELYGDRYIESDAISINYNENTITFQSNIDDDLIDIENSKIRSIQKRDGNYFLAGYLIGTFTSPIIYYYVVGFEKMTFSGFSVASLPGAALGIALGLITDRYSHVYGNLETRLAVLDKIEVMPGTYQYKVNLLSLNLNID